MRSDMFEVIIERPRYHGRNSGKKPLPRTALIKDARLAPTRRGSPPAAPR
jgi:hypothetical protein